MSLESFKPVLMLAEIILLARKNLVGTGFCNTRITTGLLEKGKTLTVNTISHVSSTDTDESTAMTFSDVTSTGTDVTITLDKTVAIKLKDRDKQEVEVNGMTLESAFASEILYTLADDIDTLIAGIHTELTDNYETGTTPWQWGATAADWPKFVAQIHKDLDDANVGHAQDSDRMRYMSLPNNAIQGMRLFFMGLGTNLGDEHHRNGMVATDAGGFRIFQNPNSISAASTTHGIAGLTQSSIALALSISPNIEKLRLQGFWADGLRARATAGVKCFKTAETLDINLNDSLLA